MSEHFDARLYGRYEEEHRKFQRYVREALHTGLTFQEYLSELESKVNKASDRLKKTKEGDKNAS